MNWNPTQQGNGIFEITSHWVKSHPAIDYQLVDCREEAEWQAGHLPQAIWIPMSQWDTQLHKLDKNKPVVVYCRSGRRSLFATQNLMLKGYTAASMIGGIMGY